MIRSVIYSLFIVVFLGGCSDNRAGDVRIGDTASDFSLKDQNGMIYNLAELRGKVVFLRFWADWCPNCKEEMPKIEEVYREQKEKGFMVIGINVKQSEEAVVSFVKKYDISFPTPLDKEADIAKRYGVMGLPTTFIIDRDGKIREKIMGDMKKEDVERVIMPLL